MLLAIETAFDAVSVALLDRTVIVAEEHRLVGRGHAELLVSAVARVVGEDGRRVGAIVVDVGPGSFTGVRVGIAAARALGLAWNVPVAGVGSLTLIAAAAFDLDPALARVAVVADAGRGQVYWQVVARTGAAEGNPVASAPHDLVFSASLVLAGAGASLVPGRHRRVIAAPPRAADARLLPPAASALPPVPRYLSAADALAA